MKKKDIFKTLLATLLISFTHLSYAQNPSSRMFGTFDYYLAGDVGDDIKSGANNTSTLFTTAGDPAISDTDATGGLGGRLGYLGDIQPHFSLGGSIGYIAGPKIDSIITLLPGGISGIQGHIDAKIKTSYIRALAEGVGKYSLNEKVSLNLGIGLGVAHAMTTQAFSLFLTDGSNVSSASQSYDENALGFTWEASPSVDINFEKSALSLGVRYTQLPKIKETDNTLEIDWKAFGFFAGLKF